MKPLVIYHKHCSDGFAAAWCFHQTFGDTFEYIPGVYGVSPPNFINREVYLVDFSYPKETLLSLIEKASKVTILDHHTTALKEIEDIPESDKFSKRYCTEEHSGAMIAWKYITDLYGTPGEVAPIVLQHIEDRDLWKFKISGTKEVMAAVFSYEYDFKTYDWLMHQTVSNGGHAKLYDEGVAILRAYNKNVEAVMNSALRWVNFEDMTVPLVNTNPQYTSEIGSRLAEEYPFAMMYYDTKTFRVFSLRSKNPTGMDVSAIAKSFGGGGHKHAAGFKVDRNHPLAKV